MILAAVLALAVQAEGVYLETGFEEEDWRSKWGASSHREHFEVVEKDDALGFEPLRGRALRVRIRKDGHYGGTLSYRFAKQAGAEPEEVYFRYYLRFADDWDPPRGGKLPGIAGTYGRAGWGGRRADGTNGWSARGLFTRRRDGRTPIGFYCYHADQRSRYGDNLVWDRDGLGLLPNNAWVCVEQYVRMNTPGERDGVLRGWIDGKPAFERKDLRFRDRAGLKIEQVWLNFYHGGTTASPTEDHLYLDEVVISRAPVGPIKRD